MNSTIFSKKTAKYICITTLWLAIWEIASLFVDNNILLAGPWDVAKTLINDFGDLSFYKSIGNSFLKIAIGFAAGTVLGLCFAILSARYNVLEDLLEPLMSFMKAAPVASFVVLFLIWWHSNVLSVAICICVVLPQIYVNVLQGIKSTDIKLIQMSSVYKLHPLDKLHYIYRPAVYDFLQSAVKTSAGMAWKAGVAAEVIGTPKESIGSALYMSKIYLDTAGVLSWTVVIILLSILCEKLLLKLLFIYSKYEFKCYGIKYKRIMAINQKLMINHICKSYGEKEVLNNYSIELGINETQTIRWASGAGKTTLLNIVAGIDKCDYGTISPEQYSVSYVFQEDRLVQDFSAVKNVEMICNSQKAKDILLKLLSEDDIYKPVCHLSGGQRRRVAIARACALDADVALFDEPYEGLDEQTRNTVERVIMEYALDRIVIIASHI